MGGGMSIKIFFLDLSKKIGLINFELDFKGKKSSFYILKHFLILYSLIENRAILFKFCIFVN